MKYKLKDVLDDQILKTWKSAKKAQNFSQHFLQGTCTPPMPRLHDTTNQDYPSFWNSVSYFDFLPAAVLTEFTLEPILLPNLVDSHQGCIANFIQDAWQDLQRLRPGTHTNKVSVFTEGATGGLHKSNTAFPMLFISTSFLPPLYQASYFRHFSLKEYLGYKFKKHQVLDPKQGLIRHQAKCWGKNEALCTSSWHEVA